MMRHLALAAAIAAVALAATCPQATSEKCDLSVLNCCDEKFQQALQLSNCSGTFYDEPTCHRKEIEQQYTNGIEGLFTVCGAFTMYYQCLGISAASCTSARLHVDYGMDVMKAKQLEGVYQQFGFACGAGLDAFANSDTCMSNMFKYGGTSMDNCRNQFIVNVETNPMQRCNSMKEYMKCVQSPFEMLCGMEAGWWGCEYTRTSVQNYLPECFDQCTVINTDIKAAVAEEKEQ